ncbi:MAG: tRNA (adenosine(37)-N6)-threonylcarbamoyltransferase complex ATPase subunit type 1 TsaE [Ruminococcaceae bacterium]|nr:tRNA (adenosine(37)-N6)-threonylcarbamoyltransferase complex ATPase subunit type 1 TsaE [Oscillospiraceae bacterium]
MLHISQSPEQTAEIAAEFAKTLQPGDVVTLNGDLGVGKTAFVQGLAKALGITDYISSPTFTIVNCYEAETPLYHFDVYRIADPEEMYEIGYEEYINGDGICIIEWAELIADILPEERYDVTIRKNYDVDENYREIEIEKKES